MARLPEGFVMNRHVWGLHSGVRIAIASALLAGLCATATAQGVRGGGGGFTPPSPEDSFRRMDTNQNGQLDPSEIQALPSFFRDMLSRQGIDGSRAVSLQEYVESSAKIREQFEKARSSGEFRRPEGGGGPPGGGSMSFTIRSDSDRGEVRRLDEPSREARRDEGNDRDRAREERRDASAAGKSGNSKKTAKPKARVTKELPADYRDKDKNGDGQIGLYEWDRKAFAQFYALDRNGDGLLTPDELIAATKKSSADSKSTSKTEPTATAEDSKDAVSKETLEPSDAATAKPSETTTTKSASPESSPGIKSFVSLDSNRDGKLTEEEWNRSRTTRGKFAKAGVEITFPIQQAQFVELYDKVEAQ